MIITKRNLKDTAEKFERENGKRHAKLDVLRRAGKVDTLLFKKLYEAERRWLNVNAIEFFPGHGGWATVERECVALESLTSVQFINVIEGELFYERGGKALKAAYEAYTAGRVLTVKLVTAAYRELRAYGYRAVDVRVAVVPKLVF